MQISKTFLVKATLDQTWALLTDPYRVARCLPGAAITGQVDERTFAGTITMKVGPVSAAYKGTLRFEKLDAVQRVGELVASGKDVRGKGGADMRMTSRLVERTPGETEVSTVSDVNVVGVLAQFGRGMIQGVSDQMFDKFVSAVRANLESAPPAPPPGGGDNAAAAVPTPLPALAVAAAPVDVVSLGTAVVGRAAGQAATRPIVWIGLALIVLLVYWLSR